MCAQTLICDKMWSDRETDGVRVIDYLTTDGCCNRFEMENKLLKLKILDLSTELIR